MKKTQFIFYRASFSERAIAWGFVVAFVAMLALVLYHYAAWPLSLSVAAAVLGHFIVAMVIIYGRLIVSWLFRR